MIEGIIVCVLLILALFGLHLWNKPKKDVVDRMAPPAPAPTVRKPSVSPAFEAPYRSTPEDWARQREADARRRVREEEEERQERRRRREREEREEQDRLRASYDEPIYDNTPDLLTTAVTAAAAVIIADTVYDTFVAPTVDTSPSYDYSSPTPSSYSDSSSSSSSSWGGDSSSSSSSYESGSSSSYDSGSSW